MISSEIELYSKSRSDPNTTEKGAMALALLRLQQHNYGKLYPGNVALYNRPMLGYRAVYPYKREIAWREDLRRLGLEVWENLLRCEIYLERDEDYNVINSPFSFNVPYHYSISDLKMAVDNTQVDPDVIKWIQKILENLDPQLDPKMVFQWARIIILDMKEGNLDIRLPLILKGLNPRELKNSVIERGKAALTSSKGDGKAPLKKAEITEMASENLWDEMFNEIKNPTKRADIQTRMEAAVAANRANEPSETEETVLACIYDIIWHEFSHAVAPYMNTSLVGRMFKVMGNPTLVPVTGLWVKNRAKACLAVRASRMKLGRPVDETSETWHYWKFYNEQFADYFSIYLKKRLGQEHFCTTVLGITLPTELEKIFDEFFAELIDRSIRKHCYILTEEEQKGAMLFAQDRIGGE